MDITVQRIIYFGAPIVGGVGGAAAGSALYTKHPVIGSMIGALLGVGVGEVVSAVSFVSGMGANGLPERQSPQSLPSSCPHCRKLLGGS